MEKTFHVLGLINDRSIGTNSWHIMDTFTTRLNAVTACDRYENDPYFDDKYILYMVVEVV